MNSDLHRDSPGGLSLFNVEQKLHTDRLPVRRWHGSVVLAVVGLMVWGCGYTLVGSPAGRLDERAAAVAVEPFINETREPQLEHYATAALRQALMQGRGFVLASTAAAPTRVQGRVRSFRATALSYGPNDNVLEYRLEADVRRPRAGAGKKRSRCCSMTSRRGLSTWWREAGTRAKRPLRGRPLLPCWRGSLPTGALPG